MYFARSFLDLSKSKTMIFLMSSVMHLPGHKLWTFYDYPSNEIKSGETTQSSQTRTYTEMLGSYIGSTEMESISPRLIALSTMY